MQVLHFIPQYICFTQLEVAGGQDGISPVISKKQLLDFFKNMNK